MRAGERQLHRESVDFDEEANARVSGVRDVDASVNNGRKDAIQFLVANWLRTEGESDFASFSHFFSLLDCTSELDSVRNGLICLYRCDDF